MASIFTNEEKNVLFEAMQRPDFEAREKMDAFLKIVDGAIVSDDGIEMCINVEDKIYIMNLDFSNEEFNAPAYSINIAKNLRYINCDYLLKAA